MCGIFGILNSDKPFIINSVRGQLEKMMKRSLSRGREASGLVAHVSSTNELIILKSDLDSFNLLRSKSYRLFLEELEGKELGAIFGHTRLATNGTQLSSNNNQPVITNSKKIIGVHNGIITNTEKICAELNLENSKLDTQILLELIEYKISDKKELNEVFNEIEGSASFAFITKTSQGFSLVLGSNTGSLYFTDKNENTLFASEKIYFDKEIRDNLNQVKPGEVFCLVKQLSGALKKDLVSFDIKDVSAPVNESKAASFYTFTNNIESIKKHTIDQKKIAAIKRCTKCILPSTTPFISFDRAGVCNFCREHEKIKTKGLDVLKAKLNKLRKNDGKANCLAAFSGGRDSSYGLYFLKEELGLTPIAYTYDWGMITDIGRRNQARVLGKLGVEHIVISADITKKRSHIKANINAWMKDPHLGMVPLFMQGDKQCEFYANQIMKKYELETMFFFRGNELEREEFKNGHCGIKDADPGGVIHNLELSKKMKLLAFYALRYLKNPSYFNASIFDVSLAYYATYMQKHNYIYLWHYIPWKEDEIINTLKNEFNWETSKETNLTWRTDDGSSAFYNYIYYQIQGFTENDSFRSRQIREGLISREEALKLVFEENKPRYEDLKWYFDMLSMNGSNVLSVVDNVKKLY